MSFVLKKDPSFRREVSFAVPTDEGAERVKIHVRFKALSRERMKALAPLLEGNGSIEALEAAADTIVQAVVGWEGVSGEDGVPLPCTAQNVRLLLDTHAFALLAFVKTYADAVGELAAKNAETSGDATRKAPEAIMPSGNATSSPSSSSTPAPAAEAGTGSWAMAAPTALA